LTCDSQGNGSKDWNSTPCGPRDYGKFGILESLCLLHSSLADGGAQTSVKRYFLGVGWNNMLSKVTTTFFIASTFTWKQSDRAWNGITNVAEEKEARTVPSAHKTMGTDF
jgi:hypothetical protein